VTVIASASGTRIDCDVCGHHTAAPRPPGTLRLETGFVLHAGRDWCPGCWSVHTRAALSGPNGATCDEDPAAA
jgi:hypothetical protein